MKFAFYGSLRPGQYNFDRFDLQKFGKVLGTHIVPGFAMIDVNGYYPKVFESSDTSKTIVVDIVEVTDASIAHMIHRMEEGAGYEAKNIRVGGHEVNIYVSAYPFKQEMVDLLIPSGDWVKYNTERLNGRVRTSTV